MAAPTKVLCSVLRPDGTPYAGATLRFVLTPDGWDPDAVYPGVEVVAVTDNAGYAEVDLWPNEAGEKATVYRYISPSGRVHRVTVPASAQPITLSELLATGIVETDPQYPTLKSYVDERVETTVADEVSRQIGEAVGRAETAADTATAARDAALGAQTAAEQAQAVAEAAASAASAAQAAAEAARDEAAYYATQTVGDQALYVAELPQSPPIGRRVYVIEKRRPYWWDGAWWRDALGAELDMLYRLQATDEVGRMIQTFTRASPAFLTDRDGKMVEVPANVPRIEWLDLDGDGVRETPALRLEPAATNLLLDSCNLPASGSAWGSTSNFTVSPAASLFAGQTAWRHTNDGLAASRNRSQSGGQFGSGPHTAYVIVENVDAAQTALNIRDTTAGANVCVGRLSWATGEAGVQEGTGAVRAEKLADAGPNGGPVYLLAVTATGTPGNNRRIFLYPTGTGQNTDTVIIHHVQLEERPVHTSPIVTTTAAVTRAADVLTSPWPHAPQAMTGYLRFVERGAIVAASANVTLFRLGTASQGRIMVERLSNDSRYVCRYFRNDSTVVASVLPTSPVPAIGDQVELLWRLYADGSVQIEQSINGGAPVVAARSSAIGLPAEWGGQVMRLSGVPNSSGNEAPAAWMDVIVLRGADWTMDQIRQRFGIS